MKKSIVLVPVLLAVLLIAGRCAAPKGDGIKFYDKSWQEVLAKAKAEHKPIFMDIYATWCGPCKMLKRETFTDKEVARYFNEHFVNVSYDGETGDGLMLARKFGIEAYPSLFILDEQGNMVKMAVGYHTPEDLIGFAKSAVKK